MNAIKFYLETVLGRRMPTEKLRPRHEQRLPVVLSEGEVRLMSSKLSLYHAALLITRRRVSALGFR